MVVICSSCIAIIAIIVAVLVGANALSSTIAVMSLFSFTLITCLSGLVLIAFLNSQKQLLSKLVLSNDMEFSKEEKEFLQTLIDLPTKADPEEIETTYLNEKIEERVFIQGRYYRNTSDYKHNVAERVANLEKLLEEYVQTMITALLHDSREEGLSRRILKEIQDLFVPKLSFRHSKLTLFYYLNKWSELLQKHSCADFLILILEKPEISCSIVEHVMNLSSAWGAQKGISYLKSMLCSFNLWMFGFFLSENYKEVIEEYNKDLLTEEVRLCIEKGNFVQLICKQLPTELLNRFISILPVPLEALAISECYAEHPGINSEEYVNNDPALRMLMDELNLHIAFCLDLPSVSSWSFKFVLAKNLSSLWEFCAFVRKHQQTLLKNVFLLIEFLHSHKKYQSLIREILSKAMPISSWKALLQPLVSGMFRAGIINHRELRVMASHLGIHLLDLMEIISSSHFLEELLPELFTES
ncbi:hypothetical protein JG731_02595 [Chlamydia gallinacea]|uniref:Uncharacterized protein n=2 Tax=Chlamydia gallinacea TaxID=1457153 RepID=A0A173E031_9CHLA|nr:hypothetical protein M787_004245 [Chlamydia gallinacea 08-1274/3]MBX6680238.1 hypothetical protein [Chlamydia gallinacea]MBX6687849.1 hypothetical protein [Chlamydia gallinacea]